MSPIATNAILLFISLEFHIVNFDIHIYRKHVTYFFILFPKIFVILLWSFSYRTERGKLLDFETKNAAFLDKSELFPSANYTDHLENV